MKALFGMVGIGFLLAFAETPAFAAPTGTGAPAQMPVREVTVFKDGHAFVLHAGTMPTNADGDVVLDRLPTPVLGTFWPYSADKKVPLVAVTACPSKRKIEKTALNLREMLIANPGANVRMIQTDGKSYDAQIVGVPEREPEAPTAASPGSPNRSNSGSYGGGFGYGGLGGGYYGAGASNLNTDPAAPPKADAVLLRTKEGVTAVPFALIRTVTFKGEYKSRMAEEEYRNQLTLKLAWPNNKSEKTASVGMFYLQKGIRWIPGYKISIDGQGHAVVKLQATIINEMVDLKDVTANLVIGVPSFFFKETPDPISLQQSFPALSRYFQPDSQTGFAFSNAIMGQGGFGGGGVGGGQGGQGGASVTFSRHNYCAEPWPQNPPRQGNLDSLSGDRNEDLFVFTAKHITLKQGQTMTLPVAEASMTYKDIYTLEVPFAPPQEVRENIQSLNREQQAEFNRITRAPRVQHRMRLLNQGLYPITTAPVLVVNGDRVVAQAMSTYTPVGESLDLILTTAGDVKVVKTDREVKRTPDGVHWNGDPYAEIDMAGQLSVSNLGAKGIDLEVVRYVPGRVKTADHGGKAAGVSPTDSDNENFLNPNDRPYWWTWYSWPYWWPYVNNLDRVTWSVHLETGQSVDLQYTWSYYWR